MAMDVVALGELLVDFTPAGKSAGGNNLFEQNPGGAPANVLAALTRLGGSGAFIGKVGRDQFGAGLGQVLSEHGIETKGLVSGGEAHTTLAFVHLDATGDRSFSFCRKPGADTLLRPEEVDFGLIDSARIFHFGSLSLTDEPSRSATLCAVEHAQKKGKIISYDPNWRPPLWKSNSAAREGMSLGLKYADIVKLSEEELFFLTGTDDLPSGAEQLYASGKSLVVVTLGAKGCYYHCSAGYGSVPGYAVRTLDTTGAGDGFVGAMLYHLSRMDHSLDQAPKELIEEILSFANAVGALVTTKPGAIPAMPTMAEVLSFMEEMRQQS